MELASLHAVRKVSPAADGDFSRFPGPIGFAFGFWFLCEARTYLGSTFPRRFPVPRRDRNSPFVIQPERISRCLRAEDMLRIEGSCENPMCCDRGWLQDVFGGLIQSTLHRLAGGLSGQLVPIDSRGFCNHRQCDFIVPPIWGTTFRGGGGGPTCLTICMG